MYSFKPPLARARKAIRALRQPSYRQGLRYGVAAATEHEAIPFRTDFRTVVDIGANRGQFALFAAQRFPAAALLCFEPLPLPRARLTKVIGSNRKARVFDAALSDHDGIGELHVSRADDSSSLLPIGQRQREAFPGTDERTTAEVTVRRLDGVLGPSDLVRPVMLKLDVQGGELAALRGSEGLLDAVDAVLVEASFVELYVGQPLVGEVWSFLAAHGFSCHGIWSPVYGARGECLQSDFLFAREGFEPLTT